MFITKTGTVNPDYNPSIERGKVGGTAGYTYETDINAYINGKLIQAYAIDGKMVAKVEEMGTSENLSEDVNTKYQMSYTYDDSKDCFHCLPRLRIQFHMKKLFLII